jgi:hypothetical protein
VEAQAYKRPEAQKWYAGETISLGIGQGYNAFTMLQLAQATGQPRQQRRRDEAAPGEGGRERRDARSAR